MSNSSLRPLLRWAGSKKKLVPKLSSYWNPAASKYIEPFFGSGALYFSLCPARAVLGDLNSELVDMYRTLRDRPDDVYDVLCEIEPCKEHYLTLRALIPKDLIDVQRCARFLYLNRYCFNGLFRTNRAGHFNVPYSGRRTGQMPSRVEFLAVAQQLHAAELLCGDFDDVVRASAEPGDFVYLDPPYAVSNVRIFKQYGPDVFGLDDLIRLRRLLEDLDGRGVSFVLSYASCEEADHLFKEWSAESMVVKRNIAGFAKHRRAVPEVIYSNNRINA